jgi:adenine-specific DNA-methyltransferase
MTQPENIELTTTDLTLEKRAQLKRALMDVCPEIFSEGAIDFEQMRRSLGDWVEPSKQRFGLSWPGKAECMKVIQQTSTATLKPIREHSVSFDQSENLMIEGDNLEVLKILQKSYFGKIKLIYIDPPYNTGNEFIYPDNFSESIETYLRYSGQVDPEMRKVSTNTETYGRYHSKWLNMMYPRLYLARNLLRDDGVIFISIDDHELANLRHICDEIFGEEEFLGCISRATGTTTGQDAGKLGSSLDYILVYRKSEKFTLKGLDLDEADQGRFQDTDEVGAYSVLQMRKTGNADRREDRPSMFYEVTSPTGEKVLPIGPGGYESRWRFGKETFQKYLEENLIVWKENREGKITPYVKYYLEGRTKQVSNLWDDIDGNKKGTIELRNAIDAKVFDNPKPTALIKKIINVSCDVSDIVLDFFAGSGTTAEAVIALNEETGSKRRFILVQLPEVIEEVKILGNQKITKISEITCARIIRACEKYQDGKLIADEIKGFKKFSLSSSCFRLWSGDQETFVESGAQLDLHVDHVDKNVSPEDVLYELLLRAGFEPTTKVETINMAGHSVYSIESGALLVCLDEDVTPDLIDALAEANPLQVICLDRGFKGNDQLKANAVQTFKARAQAEESEIVFRTV